MQSQLTTRPIPFCFVLMPFSAEFDDVYHIGIKEACAAAGAYCERVDEQIFHESILNRIYNQIAKADFVVADMTGRNPNVFYEVGYAHALGRPTVLLTQNSDDIPFDLKHFPHIIYESSIGQLRNDLTVRLRYFVENPPSKSTETRLPIDLFVGSTQLPDASASWPFKNGQGPHFKLTLHNASFQTLQPNDFRIGIVTEPKLSECTTRGSKSTVLPNSDILHMLTEFDVLFPEAYASTWLEFRKHGSYMPEFRDYNVTIRLFTANGSTDFKVLLTAQRE